MKKRHSIFSKNWPCLCATAGLILFFSLNLQAQTAPVKHWDKSIGGNNSDKLWTMQNTSDGNVIMGGTSSSGISGDKTEAQKGGVAISPWGSYPDFDFWIVKLDINGNKLWDKTIGGTLEETFTCIDTTADAGYIVGGTSISGISGDKTEANFGAKDYWIVKLDANGAKVWDKTFGGIDDDILTSIKQTTDGGYILGGYSNSAISGNKTQATKGLKDYWILKLDATGNKLWEKSIGGINDEMLTALYQTSDGGYILGGTSNSDISGDKTTAIKGGTCYNASSNIVPCKNIWLVKLNANGNIVWDKAYSGIDHAALYAFLLTSDGGFLLGGDGRNMGNDKSMAHCSGYGDDYWILKLDGNGIKEWDKQFCGNHHDGLTSLFQASDGGYLLGGTSYSEAANDKTEPLRGSASVRNPDFWIIKTNATGNKLWDKTLGSSEYDTQPSLLQMADGGFLIGGWSGGPSNFDKTAPFKGDDDYWLIKLGGNTTGVNENRFKQTLSISPNPNQGQFKLQLSNLNAPVAKVIVSDILDRKVLQKEFQTTNNQLSEELTLPNAKGMYLLQIKAGEQVITRKVVVE